ncbi:Putative GTP cyclohydrolase 1 type 2, NIF3 family [Desulfotomaculum arcticum]|uniref:Putative GTP cyclohydrolase 1 type 2, NIF3 family n=1 Tax=Desulfotruncus arcticus DSM 17038 TaxID=1121424 RepID=A0A1I2ZD35_9FIRM|nr:NGG1p interacting factor NIF3 [Desulfotruncus arcticus]SFH35021.1 Putative GTP cyclohydrolase 1 type 2, NIF3 family [Desulfotomaculum arcticum] [Desulfotruncus arcticus DSM 17038]
MKIKEIYEYVVARGMEKDPRGIDVVKAQLAREKKRYEEMKEEDKKSYDTDRLTNPYSDTRVLYGDPETEVKSVLVGIDMEVGEVLLADRLGEKGKKIDLIMSHHPEGKALAGLHDVMHLQEDILADFGVPINVAEGIMVSRISEVKRGLMPLNHNRAVDAARVLGLPIMCTHTVADNQVTTFLQELMDKEKPVTLSDIIKLLKTIPEYAEADKHGAGPTIVVGNKERRAGKILVDMTGGTGGSEDAYAKLSQAGVGTLLVMHIGEKHRKEAEKNHVNVIIAGHMASDSIGMNLLLDGLENKGPEIITCSGLIRNKRS